MKKATKQRQNRPRTRAQHGSPVHTRQIGAWVTKEQFRKFHDSGGSEWLRRLIEEAP
jgi:hypothetical protein